MQTFSIIFKPKFISLFVTFKGGKSLTTFSAALTVNKLLDNNLLAVKAAENVVRLLPPLNVTRKEINLALKIILKVCEKYK